MNGWVIAYLFLNLFGLGYIMAKHGEPQGNYNFWSTLIANAIVQFVLYKGGLYS